jgi:hypothetical protein
MLVEFPLDIFVFGFAYLPYRPLFVMGVVMEQEGVPLHSFV